jgi:hypothetical protein
MMRKIWILLFAIVLSSCVKENIVRQNPELPFNPYDTLTYNNNVVPPVLPDSNSFLGIHQYILSVKCAQPACHDGAFEPDYRTVTSSYNTLVYAKVFKNSPDSAFKYRVKPYDTAYSWLHERITTDDAVLGRMPLYDTLPKRQIDIISDWILNGAKDIFGNVPQQSNPQPSFFGIVAYLTSNNFRVDTIRGNSPVNPFLVPANTEVDIWFGVYDDITLPPLLGERKIKLSKTLTGFNTATAYNLLTEFTPFYAPAFNNVTAPYFLHYKVNTANYNSGDLVFMRVYVQDGQNSVVTEIPSAYSPSYLQTYFSFIVQ